MRAWRFHGFGDMRLDEVPVPELTPDTALVRVRCVQPSVTEAILARGGETIAAERVREKIERAAPVQLFGHEFCAEVVAVGDHVRRFAVGDRVTARSVLPCGRCGLCLTERTNLCASGPAFGIDYPGCFAELALVPEIALALVPDAVTDSQAACLQPLAECVAAVDTARLRPGESALVIGQGAIGLLLTQVCLTAGARRVVAVDVREEALVAAQRSGADIIVDGSLSDARERVLAATDGLGADVVFETAAGARREGLAGAETMRTAASFARDSGRIVGVSIVAGETPLDLLEARVRSLDYLFPSHQTIAQLEHAGALVASGRVRLDEYLSHSVDGIESVPEAFELTADKVRHRAVWPCQVMFG